MVISRVPTALSFRVVLVAEEKAGGDETMIEAFDEEGGLTIDDTSEFVRGIILEAKPEPRVIVIPTARATSIVRESPEADAIDEDQPGELETGEISIKEEEEMQAALMALENVYSNEDQDIKQEPEDDFEVSMKLRLLGSLDLPRLYTGRHCSRKSPHFRWPSEHSQHPKATRCIGDPIGGAT